MLAQLIFQESYNEHHQYFFKNPTPLKINLHSKNSLGKQKNINWIISPTVSQANNINSAVLVGENIDLKENNIAEHL